jgi:hypothetical protein
LLNAIAKRLIWKKCRIDLAKSADDELHGSIPRQVINAIDADHFLFFIRNLKEERLFAATIGIAEVQDIVMDPVCSCSAVAMTSIWDRSILAFGNIWRKVACANGGVMASRSLNTTRIELFPSCSPGRVTA